MNAHDSQGIEKTQRSERRSSRYTKVAIAFHWLIAVAMLFQIGLGWSMVKLKGLASFDAFQLHKSIGILVLLLSVLRLAWRLAHAAPAPIDQPAWMQRAASLTHVAFYGIMIGLPLSGWIMVSTARIDIPTLLFHTIPWPHLPLIHGLPAGEKLGWYEGAGTVHAVLVWSTLALLALHAGAVAKHQIIDRDGVLDRMAPGSRASWGEPRMWGAFALLLAAFGLGGQLYRNGVAPKVAPMPSPAAPAPVETVAATDRASTPTAVANSATPVAADDTAVDNAATAPDATPAKAEPASWTIAPADSSLDFTASWSGQPIDGHFTKWNGDILFSPDALDRSRIRIEIDLASAATGDSQRDSSLPGADWFDVADHPKAVWTSGRITRVGPDRYRATGILQLRGTSAPLALDFGLKIAGDHARASGTTVIDRVRFGVGQGQWAATDQIAADVALKFSLQATRK